MILSTSNVRLADGSCARHAERADAGIRKNERPNQSDTDNERAGPFLRFIVRPPLVSDRGHWAKEAACPYGELKTPF